MRRLVEAEGALDFQHDRRIQAAGATIGAGAILRLRRADFTLAPPGDATKRLIAAGADFGQHLLDRPARGKLRDREIDDDDAEQRRHHQQQAAEQVAGHRLRRASASARSRAGSTHQDPGKPSPKRGARSGLPNLSHHASHQLRRCQFGMR